MMPTRGYIIHHVSDGTGRDTYINNFSGGLMKPYEPVQYFKPGSFYPQKPVRARAPPNPVMVAKSVHYLPDGSGRDRYVE